MHREKAGFALNNTELHGRKLMPFSYGISDCAWTESLDVDLGQF